MEDVVGDLNQAITDLGECLKQTNNQSWWQRLLLPAIQAGAQLAILRYQQGKIDDANRDRLKLATKAVDEWNECVDDLQQRIQDATDDVPEAAMYQPVSTRGEHLETVGANNYLAELMPEYTAKIDADRLERDMARIVMMNPKYNLMNEVALCQIQDLLDGNLSISKVLKVTTTDAQSALINGRIGASCALTRINLGIEEENVKAAARQESRVQNQFYDSVTRLDRLSDPEQFMMKPEFAIGIAVQQAQLLQNAAQNSCNASARKPPFLMQQLLTKLDQCRKSLSVNAAKSGLVSSWVPNYSAIFGDQINSLAEGIVGLGNNNPGSGDDARGLVQQVTDFAHFTISAANLDND